MLKRKFLTIYIAAFLTTFICVGFLNLIVDPYALFNSPVYDGFNQNKEGMRHKVRSIKPLAVAVQRPKTLIMGSSRVWMGIDPQHPLLQDYSPVYNYGVDLSRIREIQLMLDHAIKNSDIKRVILGLDFFMFNSLQRTNYGFDEKLVSKQINIFDFIPMIFSVNSTIDSFRVLKYIRQDVLLKSFLRNGYRPPYGSDGKPDIKSYKNFHYYTNWIFLTPTPNQTLYYSKMLVDEEVFNEFKKIIILCVNNHIDLKLYISPAHATLEGEGIKALGKEVDFENWKRRITKIAFQYNIPLWDFGGYNSVTTEPVRTPMMFYSDSSHFTELVSDWILKRIFDQVEGIPSDFGIQIEPSNINVHLSNIRLDREKYLSKNQDEMELLLRDFSSIIGGAPLDISRTGF